MKKRVVIVVGIPGFDYSNEKSAVASFLQTIKSAFEGDGHTVLLGLDQKSDVSERPSSARNSNKIEKLKAVLKSWKWGYQSLAFWRFFKNQDELILQYEGIEPADLVVEFHTVGSTLGLQLAKKWGCHLSIIFDSPVDQQFMEMYKTKSVFWSRIQNSERLTMQAADKIMAYSPACKDYLKATYKVRAEVHVLPCIVNKPVVKNHPENDTFKIGFIGSFLVWHRVDLLVRVFHKFHQEIPNSRLQLIGHGEEWNRIKLLIEELNLTPHVDMPGFVSEDKLLVYKKNFSVGVMPGSNWYGSPLKLFEYAACEIPFIAPSTPTVKSIFKADDHCLYIDPKDPEYSLQEALRFLMNNPDERAEMTLRNKQYMNSNYDDAIYRRDLVKLLFINP